MNIFRPFLVADGVFHDNGCMMNFIKNGRHKYLKSILLWSLFSIAVMRILELFEINPYLLYLFMPGILFFLFLIYYLLKTGVFLSFLHFFLSVLLLAGICHFFLLVGAKFIFHNIQEEDPARIVLIISASIILASIFYAAARGIKKIQGV